MSASLLAYRNPSYLAARGAVFQPQQPQTYDGRHRAGWRYVETTAGTVRVIIGVDHTKAGAS